jgi:hypothetical protein
MIVPNAEASPRRCAAEFDDPGFDFAIGEAGIELLVDDDFDRGVLGRANGRHLLTEADYSGSPALNRPAITRSRCAR